MMAADSNKVPAGFMIFVLFYLLVTVGFSSVSGQAEKKDECILDDTYEHDGRDCCLCYAGQKLVEHCITSLHRGKCDPCEPGTYNSYPNSQMSCEPCTSCSHSNANLEEEEACTPARNAKCRCKKYHYCVSSGEICRLCHPCKECGAEGIKVACTASNNTVCNDKVEGGNHGLMIACIIIVILFILVVGGGFVFWRKRKLQRQNTATQNDDTATDVEMQLLGEVDIQPLMPDIAEVLGWKDMRDVAMRCRISNTTIESCKLSHPGDSQEQTLQLLGKWVESQGKKAPMNLILNLQNSGKKNKAEKVKAILRSVSTSNLPA